MNWSHSARRFDVDGATMFAVRSKGVMFPVMPAADTGAAQRMRDDSGALPFSARHFRLRGA